MHLRAATPRELPAVARRFGLGSGWTRRTARRLQGRASTVLLAEAGGKVCGVLAARVEEPRAGIAIPVRTGRIGTLRVAEADRPCDLDVTGALITQLARWLSDRQTAVAEIAVAWTDRSLRERLAQLGFGTSRYLLGLRYGPAERRAPAPADGAAIRPARAEDTPRLAPLVRAEVEMQRDLAGCFELAPGIDWPGHVAAKLSHPDVRLLVATEDEGLVGYLELRLAGPGGRPRPRGWKRIRGLLTGAGPRERCAVIEDVYLVPAARRAHRGAALVDRGLEGLAGERVDDVLAGVWARNEASLDFFGGRGFERRSVLLRMTLPRSQAGS